MSEENIPAPAGYAPYSMVDLKNDQRTRTVLFILRMFAAVFFVSVFGGVPVVLRSGQGFDPFYLWDFVFHSVPGVISFAAMGAAVYLIVIVHTVAHAAMLRLTGARTVTVFFDGISPRASAGEWYLRKGGFLVYSLGPFFLLSLIGVGLLLLVPADVISWVFIPTVAGGVVSAADFVKLAWLAGVPTGGLVMVLPEGAVAFTAQV